MWYANSPLGQLVEVTAVSRDPRLPFLPAPLGVDTGNLISQWTGSCIRQLIDQQLKPRGFASVVNS